MIGLPIPRAMDSNPTRPPATSRWNAGGWFGSQLGGTLWMFIASSVLASHGSRSAVVLLACGLLANLVGLALWTRRARLDPFRALQVLVSTIAVCAFVAVRWLEVRGEFGLLDPRVSPRSMYVLLALLTLGLLVMFDQQRRAFARMDHRP